MAESWRFQAHDRFWNAYIVTTVAAASEVFGVEVAHGKSAAWPAIAGPVLKQNE